MSSILQKVQAFLKYELFEKESISIIRFALVLTLVLVFFLPTYLSNAREYEKLKKLELTEKIIDQEIQAKREFLNQLESGSSMALEKMAREQWGYSHPGEKIYRYRIINQED
jgi:cell division protein FtsB